MTETIYRLVEGWGQETRCAAIPVVRGTAKTWVVNSCRESGHLVHIRKSNDEFFVTAEACMASAISKATTVANRANARLALLMEIDTSGL